MPLRQTSTWTSSYVERIHPLIKLWGSVVTDGCTQWWRSVMDDLFRIISPAMYPTEHGYSTQHLAAAATEPDTASEVSSR